MGRFKSRGWPAPPPAPPAPLSLGFQTTPLTPPGPALQRMRVSPPSPRPPIPPPLRPPPRRGCCVTAQRKSRPRTGNPSLSPPPCSPNTSLVSHSRGSPTLHSPEHLVVHGFEGPPGRHGGEPAAEEPERQERGSGRGDCGGRRQEGAHGAARRTPRRVTRRTAANETAARERGRRDPGAQRPLAGARCRPSRCGDPPAPAWVNTGRCWARASVARRPNTSARERKDLLIRGRRALG